MLQWEGPHYQGWNSSGKISPCFFEGCDSTNTGCNSSYNVQRIFWEPHIYSLSVTPCTFSALSISLPLLCESFYLHPLKFETRGRKKERSPTVCPVQYSTSPGKSQGCPLMLSLVTQTQITRISLILFFFLLFILLERGTRKGVGL